jgi:hypothetical protein
LKDPGLLVEHHKQVSLGISRSARPEEVSTYADELIFGYLSAELLFDEFRASRSDLKGIDDPVETVIREQMDPFLKKQFMGDGERVVSTSQEKDALWLHTTAMAMPGDKEGLKTIGRFKAAFAELHPMRMVTELNEALRVGREYFIRKAPSGMELGADQFQPIVIALIVLARSQFLGSTYVFIHDVCGRMECVNEAYRQVMPLLSFVICELLQLGGEDLRPLFKVPENDE